MNAEDCFLRPPERPTQEAGADIYFDFNDGARISLPEGKWLVTITDDESDNILFSCESGKGWITSTRKYYVPFRITVVNVSNNNVVLNEVMDLTGKNVAILLPIGTLGDILAWFPAIAQFQRMHNCRTICTMAPDIAEILRDQYPDITFTSPGQVDSSTLYATYRIGLFFGGDTTHQPVDFRYTGFHNNAAHILGLPPLSEPPALNLTASRVINEPYVCIATQSTCQAKYWNNGFGWSEVVSHVKSLGYRVLCIDKLACHGHEFVWNHIPREAEDFTGNRPLQERVDILRHASFFIGLGSGLSWLAWACRIPVVLISGFSLPDSEFYTPYRIFNSHGCNGCWDDINLNFDHSDFFWCPRHKNTARQFECTRLITGKQVIRAIDRLHNNLIT